jgi:N,N'-diacetyllegionaminate synthase
MISAIRNIEKAMGSREKKPTEAEKKNMLLGRKSIHLAHNVTAQHTITIADIEMKRPGDGISPMRLSEVIGKKTTRDFVHNHKLAWEDLI